MERRRSGALAVPQRSWRADALRLNGFCRLASSFGFLSACASARAQLWFPSSLVKMRTASPHFTRCSLRRSMRALRAGLALLRTLDVAALRDTFVAADHDRFG